MFASWTLIQKSRSRIVAHPNTAHADVSSASLIGISVTIKSKNWAVLLRFFGAVKDCATKQNQSALRAWVNKLICHYARSYNGRFLRHRPKRSERRLNYE